MSLPKSTSRPSKEVSPQVFSTQQRPTTLPSSPRCPPSSISLPAQRLVPTSPRSPQLDTAPTPSAATTPRKSSSSSSSAAASRSYMSPTASSMAKMSRSVSMGDGLDLPESCDEATASSSLSSAVPSCPQVKDTPPPLAAVVPSMAAPHAAVVPVVAPCLSSSLGNHCTQSAPCARGLQARVSSSSKPLPDKPSLASFSPSPKAVAASSSATSRPSPVSVSPLSPQPAQQEEKKEGLQTSVDTSAEQSDDSGLDFPPPPPFDTFILSSLCLRSGSTLLFLTLLFIITVIGEMF